MTNEGFEDLVEIARQRRPSLYDQLADRPEPLVDRDHRIGVRGRLSASGEVLVPLDLRGLEDRLPADTEAVAVCLLHSDLHDAHEREVGALLERAGFDCSLSCQVAPEMREYERMVTTLVNAYVRPACRRYLSRLSPLADAVLVMTSAGACVDAEFAVTHPVRLLLSGPAAGARAAAEVAAANGFMDAVAFDMGGTSTDVCLIRGGEPDPAAQRSIAGFPLRVPSLGVHTIGAGGGSVAFVDRGGALKVGPESAGAVPGPACYGRGGTLPTVTDANLLCGRLGPAELPEIGRLDSGAARRVFSRSGIDPAGVLAVVEQNMVRAIRVVTVERGVDPRDLALVAYGGAGPLHACALADALGMKAVLVPARAGVFSAAGLLAAPVGVDVVASWPTPEDHSGLAEALRRLAEDARQRLRDSDAQVSVEVSVDCRYKGQSHELRVSEPARFHEEHERVNGFARWDEPVEVVALRACVRATRRVDVTGLPAPPRETGRGPRVIPEEDCTIWVPDGWRADRGEAGSLLLRRC